MHLIKFFVVFLVLAGIMFPPSTTISINKPDGFAELEKASIKILTTCYKNTDKTIVLVGTFSENFVRRLSSHRSFNLVLLDRTTRMMNNNAFIMFYVKSGFYKVHIVIMLASTMEQFMPVFKTFVRSIYYNSMARVLLISKNDNSKIDKTYETFRMMFTANIHNVLNFIMISGDSTSKPVIFGSNPFTGQAPIPWIKVTNFKIPNRIPRLFAFGRLYLKNQKVCKNLYFDKTRNLGGLAIKTIRTCQAGRCPINQEKIKERSDGIRATILAKKATAFVKNFFTYLNATEETVWVKIARGKNIEYDTSQFHAEAHMLRVKKHTDHAYPHVEICMFLVTQFRGNKSQLEKIISVIDGYSWIGLFIVSFITLMFFKYFLRSPLIDGFLNIVRLTCNCGILTTPRNVAPQIYLACLFFVVVTMQGIFAGNLAALLTQNSSVRQVNSIQDLADFGYRVFAPQTFLVLFNDTVSKDRIFSLLHHESCFARIRQDPSIACLDYDPDLKEYRHIYNFHASGCVVMEYVANGIPSKWAFEERLNKFLGILVGGGIRTDLDRIVEEKRLLEVDSLEVPIDPRSIVFDDLRFVFIILAIGLGFASIIFLIEIIIYRYQGRVRKTRVVALN